MTPRLSSLWAAAIGAAITLLVALPAAQAHDFDPERQVMVQVGPDYMDVLIFYSEAPGERSDLFAAQFGLHLDDQLGDLLADVAGRAFLPRVMDGLQFEVPGESPRTDQPEVQLRLRGEQIQAAAFARYHLEELSPEEERQVIVRAKDRSFIPTPVIIYGDDHLSLTSVGQGLEHQSDVATGTLDRGQQLEATFGSQP